MSKEKCIKQLGVECPHCHKILPLTISMPTYCPNCKKIMVMGYITTLNTGEVFASASEAARKKGCSQSNITRVVLGKRKKAGGLRWAYNFGGEE